LFALIFIPYTGNGIDEDSYYISDSFFNYITPLAFSFSAIPPTIIKSSSEYSISERISDNDLTFPLSSGKKSYSILYL
jgi:hypothetical protein